MASKKVRGRAAWLVTRHWIADYPKWEVAAIFSPRLGSLRVREYVELIYLTSGYFTLGEQLSMMWSGHGQTPYAAEFGQTKDGDPWGVRFSVEMIRTCEREWSMICGWSATPRATRGRFGRSATARVRLGGTRQPPDD